jgi:hypothetical protein
MNIIDLFIVGPPGGCRSSCLACPAKEPLPRSSNTAGLTKVSFVQLTMGRAESSSEYQMGVLPPVRPVDPNQIVSASIATMCKAAGRQLLPDLPALFNDVMDYEARCPPVVSLLFAEPLAITYPCKAHRELAVRPSGTAWYLTTQLSTRVRANRRGMDHLGVRSHAPGILLSILYRHPRGHPRAFTRMVFLPPVSRSSISCPSRREGRSSNRLVPYPQGTHKCSLSTSRI